MSVSIWSQSALFGRLRVGLPRESPFVAWESQTRGESELSTADIKNHKTIDCTLYVNTSYACILLNEVFILKR